MNKFIHSFIWFPSRTVNFGSEFVEKKITLIQRCWSACDVWIIDAAIAPLNFHLTFTSPVPWASLTSPAVVLHWILHHYPSYKDPRQMMHTGFFLFNFFHSFIYWYTLKFHLKTDKYKYCVCLCDVAAVVVHLLHPDTSSFPSFPSFPSCLNTIWHSLPASGQDAVSPVAQFASFILLQLDLMCLSNDKRQVVERKNGYRRREGR